MRQSPCIDLQLADDERVGLLLEDYDYFVRDPGLFCQRLKALVELRGHEVVNGWIASVQAGRIAEVVRELLTLHYDPVYAASIRRNFTQYANALPCRLPNRSAAALAVAAHSLVEDGAPQVTA